MLKVRANKRCGYDRTARSREVRMIANGNERIEMFSVKMSGNELRDFVATGECGASIRFANVDWLSKEDFAKLNELATQVVEVYSNAIYRTIKNRKGGNV